MRGATCAPELFPSRPTGFNPRSPCGERLGREALLIKIIEFQSTLPVWGATRSFPRFVGRSSDFNPRSPCGERQKCWRHTNTSKSFNPRSPCGERRRQGHFDRRYGFVSIHAPRAGSDPRCSNHHLDIFRFNPRSPCGERPAQIAVPGDRYSSFNPRSPCGERLPLFSYIFLSFANFNPRSPCGERRFKRRGLAARPLFQSTLPVRGATCVLRGHQAGSGISIHAPRAGSDLKPC